MYPSKWLLYLVFRIVQEITKTGAFWWSSGWDFAFQCRGCRFNPGRQIKIPHALQLKNQNLKQKQYCKKFSNDFENGP